jgi:hypothetical protein
MSVTEGWNWKRNNVESIHCNYANDMEEQHRKRGVVTPFILVVRVASAAMQNKLVSSMSCTIPAHQEAPCPLQIIGKLWPAVRRTIFL